LTEVVLQMSRVYRLWSCSVFVIICFHLLYLLFQFCCSPELFSVLRIWYTIMQVFFRTSYILLFSLVADHWLELSVWRVCTSHCCLRQNEPAQWKYRFL